MRRKTHNTCGFELRRNLQPTDNDGPSPAHKSHNADNDVPSTVSQSDTVCSTATLDPSAPSGVDGERSSVFLLEK